MVSKPIVNYVQSSNIDLVEYYPKDEKLGVVFKTGHKYLFNDVNNEVYEDFIESESKGRYFNKYIRGLYECEKIF